MPDPGFTSPGIEISHGPFVVRGLPLMRRRIVESENGEPLTWQTTEHLPVGETYYLCRCGGSSNKPFCDGTHSRNGFVGTEEPPSTYEERAKTYEGTGIVVRDDRSLCVHAGFCGNRVTNVWKQMNADAVSETAARSQVMAMVSRCPSGALSFRLPDGEHDVEDELRPAVTVVPDGPLFVTGGPEVTRSDGQVQETRNRVTLCRCGASSNKPYCDGSHKAAGFTG
ncbi:MAG: CDGSH iron-sulfur domain-containing protein [Actinomycetes bacterium]